MHNQFVRKTYITQEKYHDRWFDSMKVKLNNIDIFHGNLLEKLHLPEWRRSEEHHSLGIVLLKSTIVFFSFLFLTGLKVSPK